MHSKSTYSKLYIIYGYCACLVIKLNVDEITLAYVDLLTRMEANFLLRHLLHSTCILSLHSSSWRRVYTSCNCLHGVQRKEQEDVEIDSIQLTVVRWGEVCSRWWCGACLRPSSPLLTRKYIHNTPTFTLCVCMCVCCLSFLHLNCFCRRRLFLSLSRYNQCFLDLRVFGFTQLHDNWWYKRWYTSN